MDGGFGKAYSTYGVTGYYEKTGEQYFNPHRYDIERLIKKKLGPHNPYIKVDGRILDLACGSGEVTLPLRQIGYTRIEGIDPYTHVKYTENTGSACQQLTFLDILNGALDEQRYDAVIISYALHLVKESMLHSFCQKLAQISHKLIVISPHKMPVMSEAWGWKELEHTVMERIHFRAYQSYEYQQPEQGQQEQPGQATPSE